MDELDEVESLEKLDENSDIKNKILFSVIVVGAMLSVQLGYVLCHPMGVSSGGAERNLF